PDRQGGEVRARILRVLSSRPALGFRSVVGPGSSLAFDCPERCSSLPRPPENPDTMGTHPGLTTDADPVALAREVTDMLLLNAADADTPAICVQRSMLRCLAAQGLYSVAAPVADGGLGHDERALCEVEEVLAGADA